jgi:hypothetical protein
MASLSHLLAQFRQAAEQAAVLSDPSIQNRAARKVQEYYKLLCTSAEGKAGIMALMEDTNPNVRLCAAARSLQWAPAQARKVLQALCHDKVFPHSFDAEMTLEEFDAGNLSFDY